jgi:hypothetical protein
MAKLKKLNETETQIIVIYLCQMLGQPTVSQIQKVMDEKMSIQANEIEIKNALNAAKKRGLLSVGHVQDPQTKEVEDAYSMKDVRFANPPEIAHIKNVLPRLLEDEGSKDVFDAMEIEHIEGKKKGGRLPDIRDYVKWKVTFTNVLPVLGGEPFTDNGNVKATNKHRRIGDKIWIPGNLWLRAAIRDKLRIYNITESKALYLNISDYFLDPKQKPYQQICPSPAQQKGGAGTGLASFEALHPGEIFEFELAFPTTGGISEDIMKKLLTDNLHIGAKGKDYGLLQLKNITPLTI